MDRRSFIRQSGIALLGASLPALTRAGPAVTNGRLVFGVPAGTLGDKVAAVALSLLAREYKLDYRFDTLDGRSTQQASETVKTAAADGLTLLQTQSSSMVLFPAIYRALKYDPVNDFQPLAMMARYTFALNLGSAVPKEVTTVDAYLKWVSQNPDYRDIGFAVYGSQGHLACLMLAREKEIALRPQSYNAPVSLLKDLISGTLAAAFTLAGAASGLAGQGLRVLAVTSEQRLATLPNVPTFAEQGLATLNLNGWYGWFAPAATPAPVVQGLHDKLTAIQALPEYVALEKALALSPGSSVLTPEQIRAQMRTEIGVFQDLVKRYGISRIS